MKTNGRNLYKEWKDSCSLLSYKDFLIEEGFIHVEEEEWELVKDFEDIYQVSSFGKVMNGLTNKILKQQIDKNGYKTVTLSANGEKYAKRVHRLVAEAFIEGDHTGMDVNHIDGNKLNNRLSNLEFCTRKENINHALKYDLSKTNNFGKNPIKVKCNETGKVYESINSCSRDTGVDTSDIKRYIDGKVKNTCKGYTFTKID